MHQYFSQKLAGTCRKPLTELLTRARLEKRLHESERIDSEGQAPYARLGKLIGR